MTTTRPLIAVRPVELEETTRVIEFLQAFMQRLTRDDLRALFEYRWASGGPKPNRGFALWSGNKLVGFLGAIYAERPLGGRLVKTCNMCNWYIQQEFRWAAMKLLYALIAQKEYSIINLTPSPSVRQIMEAMRFEVIDRCKLVYLPWHFGREMLRPSPGVLTAPQEIARVVDGDDGRLLSDHLPFRVKHYLIREGGEYSYLILKRRIFPGEAAFSRMPVRKVRLMWYPCMEVLHLGHPQLALRHWGSLVASILRRERVLAVVVAERMLGPDPPAGARFEHRNYFLARSQPADGIPDSLYSELVVLPI